MSTMNQQRKASVFRIPLEKALSNHNNSSAADILPKLELFYKIAMSSYIHHLDQMNFKTRNVIAKTSTGANNKGNEIVPMQFPQLLWNTHGEIEGEVSRELER